MTDVELNKAVAKIRGYTNICEVGTNQKAFVVAQDPVTKAGVSCNFSTSLDSVAEVEQWLQKNREAQFDNVYIRQLSDFFGPCATAKERCRLIVSCFPSP